MRPKLTYANVVATLALFIAIGGASAFAASHLGKNSVGTKQLKKNSVTTAKIKKGAVTGAKVKKGTLTGKQINASTLGTVPTAQSANVANSVAPPEGWHLVGTVGEPQFENNWHNAGTSALVGFYKDREGMVHLKGTVAGGNANNVIFNLPPGYRPAAGEFVRFAVGCDCPLSLGTAPVTVLGADGGVTLDNSTVTSLSFDSINFRAES